MVIDRVAGVALFDVGTHHHRWYAKPELVEPLGSIVVFSLGRRNVIEKASVFIIGDESEPPYFFGQLITSQP